MSVNLNGESLKGSASKSEAAAKHLDESRAKFERAANGAQKAWRESITQASAEATSAISTARDQAVQSIERAAADAGAVATAKIDAANERAEKIIATTAKLEARQLWSVAASMCLALLPVSDRRGCLDGRRRAYHGRSVGPRRGRERVARDRSLARGLHGPRRGRLRTLRIRPLGRRSRGDLEGPRDAEVAPLAVMAGSDRATGSDQQSKDFRSSQSCGLGAAAVA
nr:hypothetical protein [Kocuria palustris]